ncbi:hypothetical protein HDU96_003725 [Phlyctochytrium bullatum]|nr:hypothetical protein HDU96_003725 [Phlyctochytrium bullatum]
MHGLIAVVAFTILAVLSAPTATAHPHLHTTSADNPPPPFDHYARLPPSERSPCPFTNSLVNHGILPATRMTRGDVTHALSDVLLLDSASTKVFADQAMGIGYDDEDGVRRVNLTMLNPHGLIEHDASMTRSDAGLGDAVQFNETLFTELLSHASSPTHISLSDLIAFRTARVTDSRLRNPSFSYTNTQRFAANGEAALVFLLLCEDPDLSPTDPRQRGVRVEWLTSVFREERFPAGLGWKPRRVSVWQILWLTNYVGSRTGDGVRRGRGDGGGVLRVQE